MGFTALASLAGGVLQAGAARSAGRAQERAAADDLAFQREVYEDGRERLQPFDDGGMQANQAYMFENGLARRPEGYRGFEESRGQQYLRQQGLDGIQASAAAQGGLFSAATMGDLGRANTDYGNTFREQYLNRLAGLSDTGMQAAGMQGTTGANAAAGMSNAFASMGNAQSAGTVGSASAINRGFENALAGFQYQRNLANNNPGGGGINGESRMFNGAFGGSGLGNLF